MKNHHAAELRGSASVRMSRRFCSRFVCLALCVSILLCGVLPLNAIALTTSADSAAAAPAIDDRPYADTAQEGETLLLIWDESTGSVLAVLGKRDVDLAATGEGEATYADRLTDRSNDIGVVSEGYANSPYNYQKEYNAAANLWVPDIRLTQGGTVYIGRSNLTGRDIKVWESEQYWDGKAPFRITSSAGANGTLDFQNYYDFLLEDDSAPNAPLKLDNLTLEYCKVDLLVTDQDIYARGNKLVIGENITTESGKTWRIYGGTEHQNLSAEGRPHVITNVVVASGDWDYVYGGGDGPTGKGTQVTIRDAANVANVYGGGERKGSVGLDDENAVGDGIHVYIEGGTVGTVYGGSAINNNGLFAGSAELVIHEDISIDVSGGQVGRIIAASDTTHSNTMSNSVLSGSPINGNAVVSISAADSVGSVAGDPNRNATGGGAALRQVKGYTRLDLSADNDFDYFDLFDVVNITGSGVEVSSACKVGDSFTDGSLTWWGSSTRDGYIGQIRVAEGAKLVLDRGGVINRPYTQYVNGTLTANAVEGNITLQATANHDAYYLSKSWVGETTEARRSLSTVAINGQGAGVTAAAGDRFIDGTDVCGLRIYGTVQGAMGTDSTDNHTVPGYSTLEVTGTPLYSDGTDYYYYIVADASANGGKAFREPEGADYIVCYRYLEGGKIGWYLREKPTLTLNNKLVRAGDTANGGMVLSVSMNTFGYEWDDTAAGNHIDFAITKATGTSSPSEVSETISLAALAGIKTDSSGRFANVVTDTVDGVEYPVSFDYIIDSTTPVDPTYYTVEADYHVIRDNGGYNDVHPARITDAARCVYDFAGNDNLHADGGYDDSVMTTFPYSTAPAGEDAALLRVYLPYGMTGALSVAEDDGHFRFTADTSVDAQLDDCATVTSDYASAAQAYANSRYAVTIGGSDLSAGVSKTLSAAVSEYLCTVCSYKNLSINDISQQTASGLQLRLTLSGLTKDGSAVGAGNPYADNSGELQIRTAGAYKIVYHFRTRTQGERDYVVKGLLSEAEVDGDGLLTDDFILSLAPYESNHGEVLVWPDTAITHTYVNGVLTATVTAQQSAKLVGLHYRLTETGAYTESCMVPIGANRKNNANVANLTADETVNGKTFLYWEIRGSGDSTAPVIARCTDAAFSYCIMDHYWIAPVYDNPSAGCKSARLNPDALKNNDEDWLAWTYNTGEAGTLVFPSDDLTFSGLKDKVNFVRVPRGTTALNSDWSNVWNQSEDLTVEDGGTYVLTSYSQTWGDKTMYGAWSDTIILTHIDYSRNRWTDSEGVPSANGRSDYLYSDFEIAYKNGDDEIYENASYRTGVVFELCGTLGENDAFTPDAYLYRSDPTNLKAGIVARSSSYSTGGGTRRIQCSDISTDDLTNKNRIEFAKSYYNTATNANAVMKVTAYLVDSENHVTLSNPVYICLRSTSQTDLMVSVSP